MGGKVKEIWVLSRLKINGLGKVFSFKNGTLKMTLCKTQ